MKIAAASACLAGTFIIAVWGFPISRMATRWARTAGQKALCWMGVSLLLAGFALQLFSEGSVRFPVTEATATV